MILRFNLNLPITLYPLFSKFWISWLICLLPCTSLEFCIFKCNKKLLNRILLFQINITQEYSPIWDFPSWEVALWRRSAQTDLQESAADPRSSERNCQWGGEVVSFYNQHSTPHNDPGPPHHCHHKHHNCRCCPALAILSDLSPSLLSVWTWRVMFLYPFLMRGKAMKKDPRWFSALPTVFPWLFNWNILFYQP